MFEKLIANLLASKLGRFIQDLNSDAVKVSLWKGNVVLKNVKLRRSALRDLGLPIYVESGVVETLTVVIPWTKLRSESVKIVLDNMKVTVKSRRPEDFNSEDDKIEAHRSKMEKLETAEDNLDQRILQHHAALNNNSNNNANDDNDESSGSTLERWQLTMANNLHVAITRVSISFIDDFSSVFEQKTFTLHVDELLVQSCADDTWKPGFINETSAAKSDLRKLITLGGCSLSYSSTSMGASKSVLRPFDLTIKAKQSAVQSKSTWNVQVTISTLEGVLSRDQFDAARSMARFVNSVDDRAAFLALRPSCKILGFGSNNVKSNPNAVLWWKYAINAVLTVLRRRNETLKSRWSLDVYYLQKEYIALYRRAVGTASTSRIASSFLQPLTKDEKKRLIKLELDLPVETLVYARKVSLQRLSQEEGYIKARRAGSSDPLASALKDFGVYAEINKQREEAARLEEQKNASYVRTAGRSVVAVGSAAGSVAYSAASTVARAGTGVVSWMFGYASSSSNNNNNSNSSSDINAHSDGTGERVSIEERLLNEQLQLTNNRRNSIEPVNSSSSSTTKTGARATSPAPGPSSNTTSSKATNYQDDLFSEEEAQEVASLSEKLGSAEWHDQQRRLLNDMFGETDVVPVSTSTQLHISIDIKQIILDLADDDDGRDDKTNNNDSSFSTFTISSLKTIIKHDQLAKTWNVNCNILDLGISSESEGLSVLKTVKRGSATNFLTLHYESAPPSISNNNNKSISSSSSTLLLLNKTNATCDVIVEPFELSVVIPWLRRSYAFWQDDVDSLGAVTRVVVASTSDSSTTNKNNNTSNNKNSPTQPHHHNSGCEYRLAEYFSKNTKITTFNIGLEQVMINVIDKLVPSIAGANNETTKSSSISSAFSEACTKITLNKLAIENDSASLAQAMERICKNPSSAVRDDWAESWKAKIETISLDVTWTEFRNVPSTSNHNFATSPFPSSSLSSATSSSSALFRRASPTINNNNSSSSSSSVFVVPTRTCALLSNVPLYLNVKLAHLPPALMPPLLRIAGTQCDVGFPGGEVILDASEPIALAALMNSVTLLLDFSGDSRGLRAVERASKKATQQKTEVKSTALEGKSFLALDEMNAVVLQSRGPFEGLWEGPLSPPTPFSFDTFEPWTNNATPISPADPISAAKRQTEFVLRSVHARYGEISVMHESRPTYPMLKAKLKRKNFLVSVHPVINHNNNNSISSSSPSWGTSLLLLRGGVSQPVNISRDVLLAKATLDQYGIASLPSVEQLRRCVDKVCEKLDDESAQVNDIQSKLKSYGEDDPVPDVLMASSVISQQLRGALKVVEIAGDIVPCQCITFLHSSKVDAERFKALLERVALETPPVPPKIPQQLMTTVAMRFSMHVDKKFALRVRRPHIDPRSPAPSSANNFTEACPLFFETSGSTIVSYESTWSGFDFSLKTSQLQLYSQTPPTAALNNTSNTSTPSSSSKPFVIPPSYTNPVPIVQLGVFESSTNSTSSTQNASSNNNSSIGGFRTSALSSESQDQLGIGRAPIRLGVSSSKSATEMSLVCSSSATSKIRIDPSACGMFETVLDVTSTMLSWSLSAQDVRCKSWASDLPMIFASHHDDLKDKFHDDDDDSSSDGHHDESVEDTNTNKQNFHHKRKNQRRSPASAFRESYLVDQYATLMNFDFSSGVDIEMFHDARALVGISSSKLNAMMTSSSVSQNNNNNMYTANGSSSSSSTPTIHPSLAKFSCSKLVGKWKMTDVINMTSLTAQNPNLRLTGKEGGSFLSPHPNNTPSSMSSSSTQQQQKSTSTSHNNNNNNNSYKRSSNNNNTSSVAASAGLTLSSTLEFSFDIQYRPSTMSYNSWLSSGVLGSATSGFAFSYSLGLHLQRCCCTYRQTYLWDFLEYVSSSPVVKRMTWLTARKPLDVHDRYLLSVAPSTSALPESSSSSTANAKRPPFYHLMTQQNIRLVDTVLFVSEKEEDMHSPMFCVHIPLMEITSDLFPHCRRPPTTLNKNGNNNKNGEGAEKNPNDDNKPLPTNCNNIFVPPSLPFPFYGNLAKGSGIPLNNVEQEVFEQEFEHDRGDPVSSLTIRCRNLRVFEVGNYRSRAQNSSSPQQNKKKVTRFADEPDFSSQVLSASTAAEHLMAGSPTVKRTRAQQQNDNIPRGFNYLNDDENDDADESQINTSENNNNSESPFRQQNQFQHMLFGEGDDVILPSSKQNENFNSSSSSSSSSHFMYHTPKWIFHQKENWTPIVDMAEVRVTNHYTLAPMLLDLPLTWMAVDLPHFVSESSSAGLASFLQVMHGVFYEKWRASYTVASYADNPYTGILRTVRPPVLANTSKLRSAGREHDVLPEVSSCSKRTGLSREMFTQLLPVHDTASYCFNFGNIFICIHDEDDDNFATAPLPLTFNASDLVITLQWTSRGVTLTQTKISGEIAIGFVNTKQHGMASFAEFCANNTTTNNNNIAPSNSISSPTSSMVVMSNSSGDFGNSSALRNSSFDRRHLQSEYQQHVLLHHEQRTFLSRKYPTKWLKVRETRAQGIADEESKLIAAHHLQIDYSWSPVYGVFSKNELGIARVNLLVDRLIDTKDTLLSLKMRNAFGRFLSWPDYIPGQDVGASAAATPADAVNYQTIQIVKVAELQLCVFERACSASYYKVQFEKRNSKSMKDNIYSPMARNATRARSSSKFSTTSSFNPELDENNNTSSTNLLPPKSNKPLVEASLVNFSLDQYYAPKIAVADMVMALDSISLFAYEKPPMEFSFSTTKNFSRNGNNSGNSNANDTMKKLLKPAMDQLPSGVTPLVIDLSLSANLAAAKSNNNNVRSRSNSLFSQTQNSSGNPFNQTNVSTSLAQEQEKHRREALSPSYHGASFEETLSRASTCVVFVQFTAKTGVYFVEAKNIWVIVPALPILQKLKKTLTECQSSDLLWIGEHREERQDKIRKSKNVSSVSAKNNKNSLNKSGTASPNQRRSPPSVAEPNEKRNSSPHHHHHHQDSHQEQNRHSSSSFSSTSIGKSPESQHSKTYIIDEDDYLANELNKTLQASIQKLAESKKQEKEKEKEKAKLRERSEKEDAHDFFSHGNNDSNNARASHDTFLDDADRKTSPTTTTGSNEESQNMMIMPTEPKLLYDFSFPNLGVVVTEDGDWNMAAVLMTGSVCSVQVEEVYHALTAQEIDDLKSKMYHQHENRRGTRRNSPLQKVIAKTNQYHPNQNDDDDFIGDADARFMQRTSTMPPNNDSDSSPPLSKNNEDSGIVFDGNTANEESEISALSRNKHNNNNNKQNELVVASSRYSSFSRKNTAVGNKNGTPTPPSSGATPPYPSTIAVCPYITGSRYSVSVIGLYVKMLNTDQVVVDPVAASLRASLFAARSLSVSAQLHKVAVTVDRGHYETLLRVIVRHFIKDEKTLVEQHAERRQSMIQQQRERESSRQGSILSDFASPTSSGTNIGGIPVGSPSSFPKDDKAKNSIHLSRGRPGFADSNLDLSMDLDNAFLSPDPHTGNQLNENDDEEEQANINDNNAKIEEDNSYKMMEIDVELSGFQFNIVVEHDCVVEMKVGGVNVRLNQSSAIAVAASATENKNHKLTTKKSSASATELIKKILVEGSLEEVLLGLRYRRPLFEVKAVKQQPISFQASIVGDKERVITGSLGMASLWLDPVTVEIVTNFLYEPYRRIILPKYGVTDLLLISDDVKLDEALILTKRQLVRISSEKKNYIKIDCQGHAIHFLPTLSPVILLDSGCTLELCNGKVFLYAGVRSVDAAVSGGNGSYTVLNRIEVISADEGNNNNNMDEGEEFDEILRNKTGFDFTKQNSSPSRTFKGSRKLARDVEERVKFAESAVKEKNYLSVGLSIALPDYAGLRELCLSVGVVLEREVTPFSFPDSMLGDDDHPFQQQQRKQSFLDTQTNSTMSASFEHFQASCRYYEVANFGATNNNNNTQHQRQPSDATLSSHNVMNSNYTLNEIDFSSLITPWSFKLIIDETITKQVVAISADKGVDIRLRCGDVAVVVDAVESASQAVKSVEESVGSADPNLAAAQSFLSTRSRDARRSRNGSVSVDDSADSFLIANDDDDGVSGIVAPNQFKKAMKLLVSFPQLGIYLVDDSNSIDMPLIYVSAFNVLAPTFEVSPSGTTIGHIQLKLQVEHYSGEAGLWQPLIEKIAVDFAFRDTAPDPDSTDESKKEPARRAGVNFGVVHLHLTPPAIEMCLRTSNVFTQVLSAGSSQDHEQLLLDKKKMLKKDAAKSNVKRSSSPVGGNTNIKEKDNELLDPRLKRKLDEYHRSNNNDNNNDNNSSSAARIVLERHRRHLQKQQQLQKQRLLLQQQQQMNNNSSKAGNTNNSVGNSSSTATASLFRQYEIRQNLGHINVSVSFADDAQGRFPDPFTLRFGESRSFNYPRIDGQEIPLRQHMVLINVENSRSIPIFIGSVGEFSFQLAPGAPCPSVVVDVYLMNAQKIVELRLPIKFENELPFPIQLGGIIEHSLVQQLQQQGTNNHNDNNFMNVLEKQVQDSILEANSTKHLTAEPLRKRCVFRPIVEGMECGSVHLGLHYEDLHFLHGQAFLAAFPVLGFANHNNSSSSPAQRVSSTSTTAAAGTGGILFEDDSNVKSVVNSGDIAAQRAVYALVSFSPLKLIPNVGGPAATTTGLDDLPFTNTASTSSLLQQGLASLKQVQKQVEIQHQARLSGNSNNGTSSSSSLSSTTPATDVSDITITLQPPFYIQNHTGVPIKVGLYYKQKFVGRQNENIKVDSGYSYAHVVSLPVEVEQSTPITQVSPLHQVYMDVMLTQPTGEVLSRTSASPALIRSPDPSERAATIVVHDHRGQPLTLLIDYKPRLIVLRAPFWIVNHTMHYLQFQFPTLLSSVSCAGVGADGVPPMSKQPFLVGGSADASSSLLGLVGVGRDDYEKRQQIRSKWKIQARVGRYENPQSGIVWTKWSDPVALGSVIDIGDIVCPLERPAEDGSDAISLSFSNHLVGGVIQDTMVMTFRARWIILNRSSFDLSVFRGFAGADGEFLMSVNGANNNNNNSNKQKQDGNWQYNNNNNNNKNNTSNNNSGVDPFAALRPHSSVAVELCSRGKINANCIKIQCTTNSYYSKNNSGVSPFDTIGTGSTSQYILESEKSPTIPIDHISEYNLNIRYVKSQARKGNAATAANDAANNNNNNNTGVQQQKMREFVVFRVSIYTRTSVMFVVIDQMKNPPFEVENRTPYLVCVKQESSHQELLLYPFSTRGFVWEKEYDPHVLELDLVVARNRVAQATLDLDPLLVVRRTMRQLKKEISIPGSQQRVFVRTRAKKDTFCISLTLDRRIDSMLTRPFAQLRFDLVLQGLNILVADTDRDQRRNIALLTLPEVFISFAQGRLAEQGAPPEDVQKIELSFGSLQLEKWDDDSKYSSSYYSSSSSTSSSPSYFGDGDHHRQTAAASATNTTGETQTNIILSMVASQSIKKNSLVILRRKDRAVPVLHIRYLAVILQPLLVTVDDPFLEDVLAFVDRVNASVESANSFGTLNNNNNSGFGSNMILSASDIMNVQNNNNGNDDDDSNTGNLTSARARTKSMIMANASSKTKVDTSSEKIGLISSASSASFQQNNNRNGSSNFYEIISSTFLSNPITSSIFETTPWSSELSAKSSEESEFMFKTVVIDSMLLDQFVASVTLVRGTDISGRDPIKERLGVLSVFVQSVDDARFDFHRIQKQNVYGKIWLLGTQLGHYYLARLKNQALNVVHIAVLDDLMRDVVNDLLDGYFTSAKVNIDRTKEITSRKRDTNFQHGIEGADSATSTNNNNNSIPANNNSNNNNNSSVGQQQAQQRIEDNNNSSDNAASSVSSTVKTHYSSATLHQLASQNENNANDDDDDDKNQGMRNENDDEMNQNKNEEKTVAISMPTPSQGPKVIQTDRGFIIFPDISKGMPLFVTDKESIGIFRKLTRFVSGITSSSATSSTGAKSTSKESSSTVKRKKESSSAKEGKEKPIVCRCKAVASALKKGQFPKESFGSAWIRLEELCHHSTWDELVALLPARDMRQYGLLIAQLQARWRPLTVFTGTASSLVGPSNLLVPITQEARDMERQLIASSSTSNLVMLNANTPRNYAGGARSGGNSNTGFWFLCQFVLDEAGFGCNRCAEIEELRQRRIFDAVTTLNAALEQQKFFVARLKQLRKDDNLLQVKVRDQQKVEDEILNELKEHDAAERSGSTASDTSTSASSSSFLDTSFNRYSAAQMASTSFSQHQNSNATGSKLPEHVRHTKLQLSRDQKELSERQKKLESDIEDVKKRVMTIYQQLRTIEAPLPHPVRTSLLSWEELCHHASWQEFVAMTNDTELRRYGSLVQQAILGLPRNVTRIEKSLIWALDS